MSWEWLLSKKRSDTASIAKQPWLGWFQDSLITRDNRRREIIARKVRRRYVNHRWSIRVVCIGRAGATKELPVVTRTATLSLPPAGSSGHGVLWFLQGTRESWRRFFSRAEPKALFGNCLVLSGEFSFSFVSRNLGFNIGGEPTLYKVQMRSDGSGTGNSSQSANLAVNIQRFLMKYHRRFSNLEIKWSRLLFYSRVCGFYNAWIFDFIILLWIKCRLKFTCRVQINLQFMERII